ncbi:3,4-dihydroxy-2-butanone-4-phosphate synthase [Maritalea mediterranea]|uniref:Multifunctional fusion protein n=1 Tax=Maritalea mediterranea TaxID=2909667 RepID=A0ABS9E8I6_9HYPH|nr:3,4-dihydroxy-2-butanone-4-phosphate synthase [Maritalea mediterranea]MCF4099118.1 3,4-dihydroxy-2-butanone-4-phosphate synthase [Maritalea mediterranea]
MSRLQRAIEHLKNGGMIVLTDDEDRENEGDLVVAAEFATPEVIRFMAKEGCGLICLPMSGEQIDKLGLPPMVKQNRANRSTAFTVSIEAREGITTGISAYDRSQTILTAIKPDVLPGEIVSPGHVFPLRAAEGGSQVRNGHTEASVDLMKLAGLNPAAVICEVMGEDGHMAKGDELEDFAKRHELPMLSIAELVDHLGGPKSAPHTPLVRVAASQLPTQHAVHDFDIVAYRELASGEEHVALVNQPMGDNPLVRVHSECLTGDAFGSQRCDCGPQLQAAISEIDAHPDGGVIIYLRGHEGRGIGIANKIRAYQLQDKGMDTVDANRALGLPVDARQFDIAAAILKDMGLERASLLSNNPAKAEALANMGIHLNEVRPLQVGATAQNAHYLDTKRVKLNHNLPEKV